MFYLFLFYVFMIPLEYLQAKIPKGPTAINYETIMMVVLTIWLFASRSGKLVASPLNKLLTVAVILNWVGMLITSFQFPLPQFNMFDPNSFGFKRVLYYYTGFLMFWLAANTIDTRKKLHYVLIALALSAPIAVRAFRSDLSGVSSWHYSDDMRVKGPFTSIGSNELGAFFVFGGIMFFFTAAQKIDWKQRLGYLGCASGYIYGVLYSYSRSTQLAFGAAMGLAAMVRHRWVIILIVLAAATTNYWLPQSVIDRWEMTTNAEGELDESAANRKIFWQLAMEYFGQSPIVGNGVGSFPLMNPAKMDTHNLYYRTLAEQGLVGIVLLGLIWLAVLKTGFELWQKGTSPFDRNYGFALITATVALIICNYFGDRFTHLALIGQYWVFVGIGARILAHVRGEAPFPDAALHPGQVPDREYVRPDGTVVSPAGELAPAMANAGLRAPRELLVPVGRAQGWKRRLAAALPVRKERPKPQLNLVRAPETAHPGGTAPPSRRSPITAQPLHARAGTSRLNLVGRQGDRVNR